MGANIQKKNNTIMSFSNTWHVFFHKRQHDSHATPLPMKRKKTLQQPSWATVGASRAEGPLSRKAIFYTLKITDKSAKIQGLL